MNTIELIKKYIKEQESIFGNMLTRDQLSSEFEETLKSNIKEAKSELKVEEIKEMCLQKIRA